MKLFPRQLLHFPHFLYLLPVFFVFHGYTQNKEAITYKDFFTLTGTYLLAAGVLFLTGHLLFRHWTKAALLSFGLLFFHLFFGAFHDALKAVSPGFFLAKYSVLLPLLLIALVAFIFFLKKTNRRFQRLFTYLNLLFFALLLTDVPAIFRQPTHSAATPSFKPCDACTKPDIYLIIADEYADSASLAAVFQYNNTTFLQELRQRGFQILRSRSNYNFTPFSMASMFAMDYLVGLEGRNSSYPDRVKCASVINKNNLWKFLEEHGYEFSNNSIFKVNDIPTKAPQSHFKIGIEFVASHTFLARLQRDLGFHLVTSLKLQPVVENYTFYVDKSNKRLLGKLYQNIEQAGEKSRFLYTHLHMPHNPYYYKKDGSANPIVHRPESEFDKKAYIEYLEYSNKVYISMIDDILKSSQKPPVILFMSDHGFREFRNPTPEEKQYYFMNMNAIYLPNGDYSRFYDGISGVNHFRVLLNTVFGQSLPLLKDSTSFLQE